MDNIISLFEYLAKSNTINFLIMAYILYWIVKKINIKSMFEKSVKNIQDSIKQSETEKENSKNLLQDAKNTMDKLPKQIEEIEKFNEQKTETFKKQLEESSDAAIKNISKNIEKVFAIEEKKISNEITSETVSDSIEQSRQNIIEMLKNKPELHYKFIEKSLDELDRVQL